MPTCRRHYPGRFNGACSLVCLHCQRPSPCNSKVGSCNCFFGACSAFTHVTACTLAESSSDPLHRKLRQFRCLRCRLDCYRVERTSSRAGVSPAEVQRLSRRTITPTIANVSTLPVSGRGEILKQLNLQQKHEISGLHIWGSDTHISHPSDVSYGRICCICICRPHGQPSVGTQGLICNKGNALCLSSPCPPLRSVWRADRTHSQSSRSGAGTVHTCLSSAPRG
jgi:hypothetical protein